MSNSFSFLPFTENDYQSHLSPREGEARIGEKLCKDTEHSGLRYVILGIEESFGPMANSGGDGSQNAFKAFLTRFLNMQANEHLDAGNTAILGRITTKATYQDQLSARELIVELDDLVSEILTPYFKRGVIPIVIGGGHNNAYPIIRAAYQASHQPLSIVNLDPHADTRALEGRHSGNPFSYAIEDGYIQNYIVLGLHKAYNNQYILDLLRTNNYFHTYFEDYLAEPSRFTTDIDAVIEKFTTSRALGIELDLDSIAFMPSSAFTPSGFSVNDARYYIRRMALMSNVKYLHLPEAAPQTEQDVKNVGKTLAYLVWDFLSVRNNPF